jgi:hypothetical protein
MVLLCKPVGVLRSRDIHSPTRHLAVSEMRGQLWCAPVCSCRLMSVEQLLELVRGDAYGHTVHVLVHNIDGPGNARQTCA